MLSRSDLLGVGRAVLAAGLLFLGHAARTPAADAPKLNVMFVMADDLRPELASFGSTANSTTLSKTRRNYATRLMRRP